MKKLIYCACAVALATACTNEDLTFDKVEAKKGIAFEAAISQEVATRGAYEYDPVANQGNFFWFAETDRINVYADNVEGTAGYSLPITIGDWTNIVEANAASYKATKSEYKAFFTSTADNETFSFVNDEGVNFVAVYPQTTTITAATVNDDDVVTDINLSVGTSNISQEVAFNEVAAPMYSIGYGSRNKNYESVGEKMVLEFKRPFPVLGFSSDSKNKDYNDVIGNLKSISVETKGGKKANNTLIPATKIAAESVTRAKVGSSAPAAIVATAPSTTATVELTVPALWDSKDKVYMSILPIQRKQIVDPEDATKKVDLKEDYTVTYTYANVTLTKNFVAEKDWATENATYGIEELDIANDFSYIVTNTEGDRTLLVLKDNFKAVFGDEAKDLTKVANVAWNNGKIALSDFTKIISNVALTKDELATLKKFTALKELELKEQTEITEGVFNATLAENITTLELPKVTKIAYKNNAAFSALQTLDVNSYEFAEDDVYTLFFNENVKGTLKTLKIEAIESLRPQFSYDRTIKFTDYAVLESVALNPAGVQLTTSAFEGCVALNSVTGIANITSAPSAFAGTEALAMINISGTIIPNHAFEGSAVEEVLYDDAQVVPTEVGESAFANATAIELMDLSKATLIGKNAFNGAEKFVGTDAKSRNVVDITTGTINDGILSGTAVVRVQFVPAAATSLNLGTDIFGAASALKQVKFTVPVNNGNGTKDAFKSVTAANIDIFVVEDQAGLNGNEWTYGKGFTKEFKSITRENGKWTMGE